MIFKVDNKKIKTCPEIFEKSHSKSKPEDVDRTLIHNFMPKVNDTIIQDSSLKTAFCLNQNIDKFGDNHHKNTVQNKIPLEEGELFRNTTSIFPNKASFLPRLQPVDIATPKRRRCCFPLTFRRQIISSSETIHTSIALQLLLIIFANQSFMPCNGQQQQDDKLLYLQNHQQQLLPQDLQKLYQLYTETSATSDNFQQELKAFSGQSQGYEKGVPFVGCLFSNDVCTQDEICFDDLILGRCISADSEIDDDEGLQPLSTDDQSFLDAEVERLLEQGFRWDDSYTQCVLQTLIGSFRYYGLDYDTTLCKAAFLPELSIERRVDVPKKFILPDGDIDSTNNNNLNLFEDVSIDKIGDGVDKQPSSTSAKDEKRTNDKSKRSQNAIFLTAPTSANNENDDALQIDLPNFYGPQSSSFSENQGTDNDNEYLGSGPSIQYPPFNFLVRQEDDGGILIEPDSIPSSSGSESENQESEYPDIQDEESDYIIPSYVLQPTVDAYDESSPLPIQTPQEEQLANLIWMANNIQEPYQEQKYDTTNDLGIITPSQQQQNPFTFHPVIWLGDDDTISLGSHDNSQMPELYAGEDGEESDGSLDMENIFAPGNVYVDDYIPPVSVKQGQQNQPLNNKKKRGSGPDIDGDGSSEDVEELSYLPVYSDPDIEFLNRHKFSTASKRSKDSLQNDEPQEEVEEFRETYEYPVMVSMDGKNIPSVHYTRHEADEPSGFRDDVDVYEPTLMEDKDTSGLYTNEDQNDYDEGTTINTPEEELSESRKSEHDNENSLGSFTFNRKERLDVKKPGPFFPNSENNFFFKKLLESEDRKVDKKSPDNNKNQNGPEQTAILGDPFGPRRSNYSDDGKGQIEYEMPLQVLNPDPKKRRYFLEGTPENEPESRQKKFLHLMMKKRFDTWQHGMDLVDMLANELGIPRHAIHEERIDDHHVQFRVDPNPQNIDAERMAHSLENDIILKKRISNQLGLEVAQAAAGDRDDFEVSKFPATSISNLLYIALVAISTLAVLILSAAILVLTRHCVRRRREHAALNKLHKQDVLESERGKVQEEYKQLCRDWSKKNTTNTVQPDSTSKTSLVSDGNKSAQSPGSATIKKLQGQDSKAEGSNRSSTSSWGEEPTSTNMDISTGHMVLAYMEDHLKNKQRLEQEWVALCGYEAEPCATTIAFKTENKKKNRYPDKLPYDHNRVILNAVLNGSNSDYINASSVTDHDPRNPSYIVTQGPLAQTVADFWQMIWEQGCVVIVMLSRLQDNGYQLCHRYWPEEGSEQYHIFEVHLVSEHVWCDDYLVRSVYLKNTRTGETRTVTQFHFRSWPAQSVPSSTKALLEFRRKVNKSYRGRSAPICVHCSDGVGRAGTYVLIDMVLNRMAKGCKEIDIAATLEHIRDQRSGMVQTRPQFEFCLMAVAEEVHAILKALLP